MFVANDRHLQMPMFSSLDSLPEKIRRRLETSWAVTFYNQIFVRIDESRFAVLYSDEPFRPNIPINVLVGLEILKSGFGWSDEEMYDHFCFDPSAPRPGLSRPGRRSFRITHGIQLPPSSYQAHAGDG